MDDREIEERWSLHPLYPVLPMLRDLLTSATSDSAHMLVITDARGVLMWIEGHHRVIEATDDMHFVCGADWSEQGAGTNAIGTAIAVDHPVQIFSAEHYNRIVHPWQCSGAPIHDPATGEILGVVDLTGHLRTAHPHTLGLVTAAAGMAEAYLRHDQQRRDERAARRLSRPDRRERASRRRSSAPTGQVLMAAPHGWLPADLGAPQAGRELAPAPTAPSPTSSHSRHDGLVLWRRRAGGHGAAGTTPGAPRAVRPAPAARLPADGARSPAATPRSSARCCSPAAG